LATGQSSREKNSETGVYEGKGEFYQEFGNLKVQIFVEDDELSIVTNNLSRLEAHGAKLLKVIKNNCRWVKMKENVRGKRLNYSGRLVDKGLGYKVVERQVNREFPDSIKVNLRITKGRLRGVAGVSEVFSVRPSMRSIFREGKEEYRTGDKILDTWIQNKKLDPSEFFEQLKVGQRRLNGNPKIEMDRDWARDTMVKRAVRTGKVGSWAVAFSTLPREEVQEDHDQVEVADYDDLLTSILDEIGIDVEDLDIDDIKPEEVEDYEQFEVVETVSNQFAEMNQFWDLIIDALIVKDKKLIVAIKDKNPDLIDNYHEHNSYNWFLGIENS
jgi:hypothetical protein